jgi:CheY-like chemotaxis protein
VHTKRFPAEMYGAVQVVLVNNFKEAFNLLTSKTFDYLEYNYEMPGMDRVELAQKIWEASNACVFARLIP